MQKYPDLSNPRFLEPKDNLNQWLFFEPIFVSPATRIRQINKLQHCSNKVFTIFCTRSCSARLRQPKYRERSLIADMYSMRSARFAANPILDFRNQKSGQSVKLFWILVSRKQQTAYSCRKIQAVETENK